MGQILVTGGTGFVGREVVRQLLAAGHRVRLFVRRKAPNENSAIEQIEGSFSDPAAVENACRGADAVVHLVGIIAETKGQTFQTVHVEATRAIVAAAQRAGVSRYIHMSALGADPASPSGYQRTKGEAEAIVRGSGLAWTIFEPSLIFGPDDQFVNQFARLLRFPFNLLQGYVFPLIGGGRTRFQPIAVENAAAAFVGAVGRPETAGQTYELTGPEPISLREILEEIAVRTGQRFVVERAPVRVVLRGLLLLIVFIALCATGALLWFFSYKIAGYFVAILLAVTLIPFGKVWPALDDACSRRLVFFHLSWPLAKAAGAFFERVLPKPPLTVDQVVMLQRDNVGDPGPAARAFGLKLVSFREGIGRYVS